MLHDAAVAESTATFERSLSDEVSSVVEPSLDYAAVEPDECGNRPLGSTAACLLMCKASPAVRSGTYLSPFLVAGPRSIGDGECVVQPEPKVALPRHRSPTTSASRGAARVEVGIVRLRGCASSPMPRRRLRGRSGKKSPVPKGRVRRRRKRAATRSRSTREPRGSRSSEGRCVSSFCKLLGI